MLSVRDTIVYLTQGVFSVFLVRNIMYYATKCHDLATVDGWFTANPEPADFIIRSLNSCFHIKGLSSRDSFLHGSLDTWPIRTDH